MQWRSSIMLNWMDSNVPSARAHPEDAKWTRCLKLEVLNNSGAQELPSPQLRKTVVSMLSLNMKDAIYTATVLWRGGSFAGTVSIIQKFGALRALSLAIKET
ncbi:hypothetical protein TNIN_401541 [Trichonephila inaurata madagascariensis]|uniref:Uncharacterized protein n=1 Tax=Trichonephila inaurata madagascariensis TaxID=2747483 RepID=A0A8X7CL37_9ARAC|nr:hypothetical protein TNIN_401541 [Trichonephila inaurata madagascariensis]